MKKIAILFSVITILLSLCACGGTNNNNTENTDTNNIPKIESCQIIANPKTDNVNDDILIYNQMNDNADSTYFHYKVKCDKPTIDVRVKVESQWGRDDITEEDFTVESDEIISVENDVWNTKSIRFSSNLYYWRITIYNGESEEIIGTKTIYTPFMKTQTTTVTSVAPEFHALNELSEEEQTLFDLCNEAIIEYANKNHYEKFDSIFNAWDGDDKIYLCVQYKKPSKMIWFSIDKKTKKYIAHFNSDSIIPDDEGNAEDCILNDYFYVNKSISDKMQSENQ